MSLSQTSDQRPVSTDNQIDRTNTTTNQETSFGESLASLLDDPNIISIHNVSNNDDAFNCIGAEDVVQTHLNYEQDPFTRMRVCTYSTESRMKRQRRKWSLCIRTLVDGDEITFYS